MTRTFTLLFTLTFATTCNAWPAVVTIPVSVTGDAGFVEAVDIGSTFIGREAFQLQGGNGLSSILYSDPFPITTWGRMTQPWDNGLGRYLVVPPNDWEGRYGLMQTIPQRDFPDDWFDIVPSSNGLYVLHQWHILEGDSAEASNNARDFPWFITGLDYLKGIRIKSDTFLLYRWYSGTPNKYQILFSASATNVPEPTTAWIVAQLVALLICRRRQIRTAIFRVTERHGYWV